MERAVCIEMGLRKKLKVPEWNSSRKALVLSIPILVLNFVHSNLMPSTLLPSSNCESGLYILHVT